MVETGAICSNLTGVKGSVNTVGVDSLNDILTKCMAVYDSNNAVKDSIQAYRYILISCEVLHHHPSITSHLLTDSIIVSSLNPRRQKMIQKVKLYRLQTISIMILTWKTWKMDFPRL